MRLLLLTCLLAAFTLTHGQCVESTSDPYPYAGNEIALGQNSEYILSTIGRARTGVRIYDTNTLTTARTPSALATRTGCSVASNGASYTPFFGQSLAVASTHVAAIGAPNRAQTSPAYSTIDVFDPWKVVNGTAYTTAATTIYDTATNNLGLMIALDTQQSFLASYYDASTIVVYSPVTGRQSLTYDTSTTGVSYDAKITLPTGFKQDSIAINNKILIVAGTTQDATTGNCVPQVLSYLFLNATSTTTRSWSLSGQQYLLRDSTQSYTADINSVNCVSVPSNTFSIELNHLGTQLIVGSGTQGCVWAVDVAFDVGNTHKITAHGRCTSSDSTLSNFGKQVAFSSKEDGATFLVASDYAVTSFTYADWVNSAVNPLDSTVSGFYQFPNRLQAAPSTRSVLSIGARNTLSVVLYMPSASGTPSTSDLVYLLPQSSVPAGQQWNPSSHTLESCPAGRFSTGTGSSLAGCSFCAVGTFQSQTGQSSCLTCLASQYCPSGSILNGYSTSSFTVTDAFSSTGMPWFEYDGYREAFEELLVSTIFSVSAWPAMILFFILVCGCFVVYVTSYWASPDGDEQDCCSSTGNCCLHTYRLLGRFAYFTQGRKGPFPYSKRPEEVTPDVIQYAPDGTAIRASGPSDTAPKGSSVNKPNQSVVHNADGSITTTTYDTVASGEDQIEFSPECQGFLALVFLLFGLSAVAFTGMYLASYDPSSSKNTQHQNVYRTRTEVLRTNDLETELAQGISAVLTNPFELQFALLGSSASCASGLVTSFTWSGCTVPGATSTAQPVACSTLLSKAEYSSIVTTTKNECIVSMKFPKGTSYPSESSFSLTLPSQTNFQALTLGMLQNSSTISLTLPETGTEKSSADQKNTALVGAYSFSETLYIAGSSSTTSSSDQVVVSPITRQWLLTPVAFRSQRSSEWNDVFDTTWYAQTSDVDSPILQTQSTTESIYAASVASALTVTVELSTSHSFTVNQTQRLVGEKGVLFVMVISVVMIWALCRIGEALFNIIYGMCCQRVHKGMIAVAQTTGATGPTAGGGQQQQKQTGLPPLQIPQRPRAALPDVMHYPPEPRMPVYGGGYDPNGWSHFEPSMHPAPYPGPNMYDGTARSRAITPRHMPYPGAPMPLTPGNHLPPLGQTTFEEDRQRYAARHHARQVAQTPQRQQFDDPRIEIEMSNNRPQRGGFEV